MQTLTTEQMRDMTQKGNPVVINVLDKEHFQTRHIPGSQNIPVGLDDFTQRVEQAAGSKDKPVIVYCASASCDASPKAAKKLESQGFTQVYDYEGGMDAWEKSELPIEGSRN